MIPRYTLFGAALLLAVVPVGTAAQGAVSMDALDVLTGCWEGGMGSVEMKEQWSDGVGGTMLGSTRYFRDGALVDYEFARIEETDTGLVLWPYPRGERSPRGFVLVATGEEIVFENLEHDFPVRIVYRPIGDDRLAPRIEGRDGNGRGWELRRADCPGPGAG